MIILTWILTLVLETNIANIGHTNHPIVKPFDTQTACEAEAASAIKNGGANVVSAVCSQSQ